MGIVLSLNYFRRLKAEHFVFCKDGKTYTKLPGNVIRARRCDWCSRKELLQELIRQFNQTNNQEMLDDLTVKGEFSK